MKQIIDFNPARLRKELGFGFMQKVGQAATSCLKSETSAAIAKDFNQVLDAYDEVLELGSKNSYTALQEEADKKFDQLYINAYAFARIMPNHPTAEVAAVGEKLLETFDKYGHITRFGYTEEYAMAYNLLQDIEALPQEQLTAMGFMPWYEALVVAKAEFQNLRDSKQFEDANSTTGIVKEKRLLAEDAYQTLVKKVNAMVIIMGEEEFTTFIDLVNTFIKEMQEILKASATRSAKKKDEEGKDDASSETTEEESTTNDSPSTNE